MGRQSPQSIRSGARAYGLAAALFVAATLLRLALGRVLSDQIPYIIYAVSIVLTAWLCGTAPAWVATLAAAVTADYLFVPPRFAFKLRGEDAIGMVVFVVAGAVLIQVVRRWRHVEDALTQRNGQLDAERARWRGVVEGIADEVWVCDAKGKMTLMNLASVTPMGLAEFRDKPVEDVLTVVDILNPDGTTRPALEAPLLRSLRGEIVRGEEIMRRRETGVTRYRQFSSAPTRDDTGNITGAVAIVRDVTSNKQAEHEIHRLNDELARRARALEAAVADAETARRSAEWAQAAAEDASRTKDHFLAVLSHELRTPLAPVLMGISLLDRDAGLSEKSRSYLEVLRRNVELESRLIDDLLDISRIERGKVDLEKRPVELCTVIERAVEVCRPDIDARRLHFGIDWGPRPYVVDADVGRLQQVFWNLLKNAIKFTPHGGCVGIRCRPRDNDVVVEVNDSGVGIDPGALEHIFDAFRQGDTLGPRRRFGGLGLGLAISKALVEMHGGTIAAQSAGENAGATFRVCLPLVIAPTKEVPASSRRPDSAPSPTLSILLVEDHGDTADMLLTVMTTNGHRVETAGDVATALDTIERCRFDLLISDLGLPDGSGLDLIRQLRARGHGLPAIAVSGYGQEQDVQQSKAAGFSAHLVKPVDPDRLADVIAAVVRGH